MIKLQQKHILLRKALIFRSPRLQNFRYFATNDNNNDVKNDDPVPPETFLQKTKKKYSVVLQIMNFLKKYFIPFSNTDKSLKQAIYKTYTLLGLSKICFFYVPFSLKYGINYLQNPLTMHYAPWCFVSYGVATVFMSYFEGRKAQYCSQISLEAWKDISLETYRHLLSLDVSFHYNTSQKSRLFSLYKAHQYIEKNIRQFLNYLLPLTLDFVISCVYLFFNFGNEFFITFFTSTIAYAAFTLKTSSIRKPLIFKQKENDKLADFIISESLANFYTVKHFNAENLQLQKYGKVLQKYINLNLQNVNSLWKLNLGQKVIFASGLTLNLVLAVWKVQAGVLTPGDVVFLQALLMQIMTPLNFLGNFYREYSESLYEMRELFILLGKIPKIKESPNAKEFIFSGGEILFKDVSFGYNENQNILKNFSLKISPGSFISIVGESGVGKSTLFSLLYRLYDPLKGDIFIDNQNLKDLKLDSFRKKISVASQQSTLFNDTIMFNLQYANVNKTKEEIIQICKDVRLHDYIMSLPLGYDTKVGEQGNKLSGGEKQRLAFARCLLKDAKIILLDEVTSALDSSNENNIMHIIQNMRLKDKELVILMVTHRMHLNNFADKIILMSKDGSIEEGVHQDLVQKKNSKYFELWKKFCEKVTFLEIK